MPRDVVVVGDPGLGDPLMSPPRSTMRISATGIARTGVFGLNVAGRRATLSRTIFYSRAHAAKTISTR